MNSDLKIIKHKSRILKNNSLKDPFIRDVVVYLPPSYKTKRKKYPVVFLIAGFTGFGKMSLNVSPYTENIQQRLDRMIGKEKLKEMIVVMPDCFTKYGGSQYVNSSATGRYEDYIIKEIVPFIDNNFRTIKKASSRCIMGKSSGGFGAMWLSMRHPEIFGLMVSHSGDSGFEYCYMKDFPEFIVNIQKYGKGHNAVRQFIRTQINMKQPKDKSFFNVLNVIGMSAAYSPNPERKEYNFDLPFDLYTGAINKQIWNKWLKFDPVRLVDKYKTNLKKLKMIFIDCGNRDEFHMQAGSRMFTEKLKKYNIKHVYQEFSGGHYDILYRYDVSFKYISENIESY